MSGGSAANDTKTVVLTESSTGPLQQSPPQPTSPTKQDTPEYEVPSSVDGRTSDADKMLESAGMLLDADGPEGDGVDPGVIDASEQTQVDSSSSGDDSQQWAEDEGHDLKRVKVYELIGARWVDQGTAFCFGDFHENEAFLIARSEADFNQVILTTTIRSSDVYQRQQDTLIVWTEPDGVDYALSFQDPEGCAEVWNFIQDVQRHLTSGGLSSPGGPGPGPEPSLVANALLRGGGLPKPALGTIAEIDKTMKTIARMPALKERVCEIIQNENYVKALVSVFNQAEDLESIENLHTLCSCMQSILMLNDHTLYEHILEDELFFGVVGILEYDPEFPTHKANYREFLHQTSRFHQPIPIRDESIQRKIHHTYRLQFLKDVVLARAIDDSTFNVLNSCILFNQIDIINHVQNDQAFLREVVGIFLDEEMLKNLVSKGKEPERPKSEGEKMDVDQSSDSSHQNGSLKRQIPEAELKRRREVLLLVQQLCIMGKNVQLPARMALFRTLCDRGILFSVQWGLGQPDSDAEGLQMISAAGEILTTLLDHDLNGVRNHVLKQLGPIDDKNPPRKIEHDTVLSVMCRVLVRSRDLAVQSQVSESVRAIMEIPQDNGMEHPMGTKVFQRPKDDPGTERFMDYFYKHCVDVLFHPLLDLPDFKNVTDANLTLSRERTNLYLHLCDLLSGFALQHSFRSHFFMLSSSIATRVASLLRAKDKHLRLAAFRFFRVLLRLNNRNLFSHLVKVDALGPILDLTLRESRRDNLLSSTCQEFFEHMRKENVKELINHCMTKHESKVRELSTTSLGGPRFSAFIRRWEMNIEPPPKEDEKVEKPIPGGPRRWGQGRLVEAEEEDWFHADDDDEEPFGVSLFPGNGKQQNMLKRKRARGASIPPLRLHPHPQLARTTALGSLVGDYDDGDEANGAAPTEDVSTPGASPRPAGAPLGQQGVPASPRIHHRQIAIGKPTPDVPEDPEDSLLESLVTGGDASSPSKSPPGELGLGLKRRREDEDDEGLERLASKSKKPTAAASPSTPGKDKPAAAVAIKLVGTKTPEDGPKKIKLKLSSPSPTPSPSSPGAKDGDTG
ncbi:hypothetical protein PsYK624_035250 [Phanerochaete sordida]|uniref:Serine/threonine-protein phosphatase 4 regulatory subunit 3-like central domain-containing protein n=1 Tax=Phanerochaete sordida TaxID=48140 RepID=A0A9P3G1S8_9APHY|nr:hypothetical protein PsYK624_035250 [Phanerochaete sordida]